MNFKSHSRLEGQHAFLSASKGSWINYDEDKLHNTYKNHMAVMRGVKLHNLAYECIKLGVKLPKTKNTLNMYVNDAIGFKMTPEQILYFSENCFGTADAISFRQNVLRIHDLKTGQSIASMRQLEIYTAIFCLEYKTNPNDIDIELRLYQSDKIVIHNPQKEDILYIMDKIISFDKQLEKIKMEE